MPRMSELHDWVAGEEIERVLDWMIWGEYAHLEVDKRPPRYSRDPRTAMHLIEGLTQYPGRRSTCTVTITISPYDPAEPQTYWHCEIDDAEGYYGEGWADGMPMAICLAVLNLHEAQTLPDNLLRLVPALAPSP